MAKGRRGHPIVDSHIHLYPRSENGSIGWIDPGHHLAGQWSVDQYRDATETASSSLSGFVIVEVNRTHDLETGQADGWSGWRGALQEVAYMSRIALGEPRHGEGHSPEDSKRCLGLVPWAPVPSGPAVLERYLGSVRKVAGAAWPRVRGFRYLLQDSPRGLFQRSEFVDGVKMLGRRGFVFEICADHHRRGQSQLDDAVALVELAHEGVRESDQVTFVIGRFPPRGCCGSFPRLVFVSTLLTHETGGRSLFKARHDAPRRAIQPILPGLGRRDRSPREEQKNLHQDLGSFQRDLGRDQGAGAGRFVLGSGRVHAAVVHDDPEGVWAGAHHVWQRLACLHGGHGESLGVLAGRGGGHVSRCWAGGG